MKASDLAKIEDPYTRFIQSMRFLTWVETAAQIAREVRDLSLIELRTKENEEDTRPTLQELADEVGLTKQRLYYLEAQARKRYEDG